MQQQQVQSDVTIKRPTAEVIIDYINRLRTRPVEYTTTLDDLQAELKKQKGSDAKIKNFSTFVNEFKAKPARTLQRSTILNELAEQVTERFQEVKSDSFLNNLISENYSGLSNLGFYSVSGNVSDGEKIVYDLLLDEKNRKDFFMNNSYRLIGVHHKLYEDGSNNKLTVILIADDINEGSEFSFTERIANEINFFRSSPSSYTAYLDEYKRKTQKEFPHVKKEFIKELETVIDTLKKRNNRALGQVAIHPGLSAAAKEHLDHLEQKGSRKFHAQDEEYLNILLSHYVSGYTECREFISTDISQPRNLVVDYLTNEKDLERTARKALLNGALSYIGLAHRVIRGTRVTVIMFTDNAEELKPVPFEEGLVKEINKIRAYPKSYVKYFQSILDNNQVPKNFTKKQQEAFLKNVSAVIDFLQNARALGPFIRHQDLSKAAEARVNQFVRDQKITTLPDEKLRDFLSDYGTGFYNVAQLDDLGSTSPLEFLIDVLIPRNTIRSYRDIIFSRYLNYIGVASSQDTTENKPEGEEAQDETQKVRVFLLADHFEPDNRRFDTTVMSRQIILKRPNLTNDEILQIKSDFKLFDVTNTGHVKPGPILFFMDKSANFSRFNFIYYEAFQILNTEKNNSNGVDVEEFINAVKKVFLSVYEEERWKELYNLYYGDNRKKVIDFDVLRRITNELKYRITDEDVLMVLERLQESGPIDFNKFTEVMKISENLGRE
jgi:Ca2+-binding EF-hand superfamily protein